MQYGIDEMQRIASNRNGICLSEQYINSKTKMTWKCCTCGKIWNATPRSIIRGTWCPNCGKKRADEKKRGKSTVTIEECKSLAISRQGICLSDIYVNSKEKLLWKCKHNHEWYANLNNIKNGSWCPFCDGKYITMENAKQAAIDRGGECLSDKYVNSYTKMNWKCDFGHIFERSFNDVKRGRWCFFCNGRNSFSIDQCKEYAKERGGICITKKYTGRGLIKWQCKYGHRWESRFSNMNYTGGWCPYCKGSISEEMVRLFFNSIFNISFPHFHPGMIKWLVNEQGNYMELDGYNDQLNIAFEYQGMQHYKPINAFHKTKDAINRMQANDTEKKRLCNLNNVILIVIPYNIKFDDMESFIISEFKKLTGSILPFKKIDWKRFIITKTKYQDEIEEIINKNGWKLLSNCVNAITTIRIQCNRGHIWETKPRYIKRGINCPECKIISHQAS